MVGWISLRDFPDFEISLKQAVLADDDDDDDDVFFSKKHFRKKTKKLL